MPFPLKIQPVDAQGAAAFPGAADGSKPVPAKSRLKRLFERQFVGGPRTSAVEKGAGSAEVKERGTVVAELEPSSLCLAKMVQNFMEAEPNERPPPPPRCGRRRCNCFNGCCEDSSEDELEYGDAFVSPAPPRDSAELLKNLVPCASSAERNLLADASRLVETGNGQTCCGGRGSRVWECRKMVADGLVGLGHDASVCRSRWEKSTSSPAGEYEYVDVILETGERLIVDIDFRSQFEIARSTKSYRAVLQALPAIFVGREERLAQIVAVVAEAARQSLKKRGLHVPPWRKPEYMRAKWLSPHQRVAAAVPSGSAAQSTAAAQSAASVEQESSGAAEGQARAEHEPTHDGKDAAAKSGDHEVMPREEDKVGRSSSTSSSSVDGELELRYGQCGRLGTSPPPSPANTPASGACEGKEKGKDTVEVARAAAAAWQLPAIKPKAPRPKGARVVTGLASIVRDLS